MKATSGQILIVGGGIAGLSLAALLHLRGFRNLVVVEKIPSYSQKGYVLGLWGNALRVMKGLGIYGKILEVSNIIDQFKIDDDQGKNIINFSMDLIANRIGPSVVIKREDLMRILSDHVRERVPLFMSTSISELTQNKDYVEVKFTNGKRGKFHVVVGADGIKSTVRDLAKFPPVPINFWKFKGWGFWVSPVPKGLDTKAITEIWGPDGKMMGFYPHSDNVVSGSCSMPVTQRNLDIPVSERLAILKEQFKDWGGIVPEVLQNLDDPNNWHLADLLEFDMKNVPMYLGRVILVGDAAHAVLPTSGTGTTLAIESAAVLAEELCRCDPSDYNDLQHTFDLFQQRREGRVKQVREKSNMLAKFLTAQSWFSVFFRSVLLYFTSNEEFAQNMLELLTNPI